MCNKTNIRGGVGGGELVVTVETRCTKKCPSKNRILNRFSVFKQIKINSYNGFLTGLKVLCH
jgi:hypothetical protein